MINDRGKESISRFVEERNDLACLARYRHSALFISYTSAILIGSIMSNSTAIFDGVGVRNQS